MNYFSESCSLVITKKLDLSNLLNYATSSDLEGVRSINASKVA